MKLLYILQGYCKFHTRGQVFGLYWILYRVTGKAGLYLVQYYNTICNYRLPKYGKCTWLPSTTTYNLLSLLPGICC